MLENRWLFRKKCWKSGGSDGTRTRGLWRDRPAANGGFLRRFRLFHLHLPTFTYNDLHKNVGSRWLGLLAILLRRCEAGLLRSELSMSYSVTIRAETL